MPFQEVQSKYSVLIGVFLMLFGTGCLSSNKNAEEKKPAVFFPSPPSKPRAQFVRSFGAAEDVEKKSRSFNDFLLGKETNEFRGIKRPLGLTVCDGVVYVCDTIDNAIKVFDFKRSKFQVFGEKMGPGRLKKPVSLAVDDVGYKFVADTTLKQIVIFDSENNYTTAFTLPDSGRPADVCLHGNNLYVLDNDKTPQVVVMDRQTGKVIRTFGSRGTKPGQFNFPTHMDVTEDGFVYVSDMLNFRIQKLTLDGEVVWTQGHAGRRLGEFARPRGINVGPDGIVYVVDAAMQIVQMFNDKGQILMPLGGPGNGPGGLNVPKGICADKTLIEEFRRDINPDFQVEYLVFVTNQVGPNKVTVYAFGEFPEGYKTGKEILSLPPPGKQKPSMLNPEPDQEFDGKGGKSDAAVGDGQNEAK